MKVPLTIITLLLLAVLSCGSNTEEAQNDLASGFSPPEDPGLSVYRTAVQTVDLHLTVRDEIDWETAVHVPSIQVTYDENGRITEAVGLWMGRPSDRVIVANFSPMLKVDYDNGIEDVAFHWANGEPFNEMGFCGYRITRSDDNSSSTMEFLNEDGSVLIDPSGIAYRQIENVGDGWFMETMHDENGIQVPISDNGVFGIHHRLDSLKSQIATENLDSLGNPLPLFGEVYLIEREFDTTGHLIARKRIGSDGHMIESSNTPGWEIFEVSESGHTTSFLELDIDGLPVADLYGVTSNEIEYDQFGRVTLNARYGVDGTPVDISGVWATEITYDDELNHAVSTTLDNNGEPVDSNGFATVLTETDSLGNNTSISFFDSDGAVAFDGIEVHQYKLLYTDHSKLLERQVWNASGEPDSCSLGFHIELYVYDEDGNFQITEYFDTERQPLNY